MAEFNENLIIRYFENNITPEEEELLLDWLKLSEENSIVFLTFKKIYTLKKIKYYADPVVQENALARFNQSTQLIKKEQRRNHILKYTKYAAIFILLLSLPFAFWLTNKEVPIELTTIKVGLSDSVKTILLPDGTKVWVNNGSTFSYPIAFAKNERNVIIEGEAYFDVKTDSLHPFYVQAGSVKVRVYGTSFNVNTNHNTIETTLVKGKVSVQNRKGKELVRLLPGQKAEYKETTNEIKVKPVNTDLYTAWHNGLVKFDKATLPEIAKKIEELYKVRIIINSKKPINNKINFVFRRSESLEMVLEMLKFVAPIQYKKYNDQVYVNLR